MSNLIVAFATDDGITFMDRHFGDALRYEIYEIDSADVKYLRTVMNTIEEDLHTGSQKARGIAGLLKKDGVQVLVSKKFGANINKMKTKFVCLLMNDAQISASTKRIQQNLVKIFAEWQKGPDRHFINLKEFK